MKKVLYFLEIFWIFAVAVAVIVSISNFVSTGSFNHNVYFPLIVAFLGLIVFYNVRSQRKFMEKRNSNKKQ